MNGKIVGSWKLENFLIEDKQGNVRNWGSNANGLLIYTADGHMSVSINKDLENKSTVEVQNIFNSILFYSGTYTVDSDTIKHKVTQASNPARIGKEMLRFAKLENNLLTLASPEESFGRAILKWRKI